MTKKNLDQKEKIIEMISNMSIIEINELIKMIENKFSIFDSNYNTLEQKKENINLKEEKKEFDLKLKNIGSNKISVIKIIRSINNLGLKESKDLVDSCPVVFKEKVNLEEANKIKKLFEDCGAVIELI